VQNCTFIFSTTEFFSTKALILLDVKIQKPKKRKQTSPYKTHLILVAPRKTYSDLVTQQVRNLSLPFFCDNHILNQSLARTVLFCTYLLPHSLKLIVVTKFKLAVTIASLTHLFPCCFFGC
jgi:hypothetical protein